MIWDLEMWQRAPACVARTAISCESCWVTKMICASGLCRRMRRAASKPSRFGIEISKRITSGSKATAFSTASRPSMASPQTVHPGCASRNERNDFLRISLSSAMSIFTGSLPLIATAKAATWNHHEFAGPQLLMQFTLELCFTCLQTILMRRTTIYLLPCILRREIAQHCASEHGVYPIGTISTENRRVPERQSAARISSASVALMLTFYSGGLSEIRPIPNRPTSINLIRNRVVAMVLLAALVAACTAVYATDFAVIVHTANPVKAMPLADLNKIFRGKTSAWPNGRNIVLVVRDPSSPAMKFILEKVMGVTAGERETAVGGPPRQKN